MTAAAGPVAVLGANGFVGRHVVRALAAAGVPVRPVVRPGSSPGFSADQQVHELGAGGWSAAVAGCAQVVHLIARTHRLGETAGAETEAAYRRVNVDLTAEVLAAAASEGVHRVVYMSSVKALGESREDPYTDWDQPQPADAYGRTKLAAEEIVLAASPRAVVLRPPLVYGPGAAGNVARLVRAVQRGMPLPLGRAHARRSLVSVVNLADAVRHVVVDGSAAGRYLVADAELLTVRQLVEAVGQGVGRRPRLVPVPVWALHAAGRVAGRADEVDRLVRPLVLEPRRISEELGWVPPVRAWDAVRATAAARPI